MKQSGHGSNIDDRLQINLARSEAEALFRPKLHVEVSTGTTLPSAGSHERKPRVLAAVASPGRETAAGSITAAPGITRAAVEVTETERERLQRARAAIFRLQNELQEKLDMINSELHAIDAYEMIKSGKH